MRAAAIIVALAAGLGCLPAAAAETDDVDRRLESVERAIEEGQSRERQLDSKAAALGREVADLRAELVSAARAAQAHEERLDTIEGRLADLTPAEAEKAAALERQWATLTTTLGALERLGRLPPGALIAAPATLTDTIRTNLLLGAAVAALDSEARGLREQLDGLADLRRTIASERTEMAAAGTELAAERRRLDRLLERKSALQRTTLKQRRAAEQRVARLAAEAGNLRELMEKLATGAAAAPPVETPPAFAAPAPARSFAATRGTLGLLPVRGRLVGLFGQTNESGGRRNGIAIETRAGAWVVTPFDGRVVFAGPFRGYGQLLIIEHGEGYHTILAGVARIDSVLGQWLLAGEPVGVMGPGSNGMPTLYVELRRNGAAINPLPWLAAGGRKASG